MHVVKSAFGDVNCSRDFPLDVILATYFSTNIIDSLDSIDAVIEHLSGQRPALDVYRKDACEAMIPYIRDQFPQISSVDISTLDRQLEGLDRHQYFFVFKSWVADQSDLLGGVKMVSLRPLPMSIQYSFLQDAWFDKGDNPETVEFCILPDATSLQKYHL